MSLLWLIILASLAIIAGTLGELLRYGIVQRRQAIPKLTALIDNALAGDNAAKSHLISNTAHWRRLVRKLQPLQQTRFESALNQARTEAAKRRLALLESQLGEYQAAYGFDERRMALVGLIDSLYIPDWLERRVAPYATITLREAQAVLSRLYRRRYDEIRSLIDISPEAPTMLSQLVKQSVDDALYFGSEPLAYPDDIDHWRTYHGRLAQG